MINIYDEDNIDLETEMYLQDVEDELEENEDTYETEQDDLIDYELTTQFLTTQLKLVEQERTQLRMKNSKTSKKYEGIVIGQSPSDKNRFVFILNEIVDGKTLPEKVTKIFNIHDIKKY